MLLIGAQADKEKLALHAKLMDVPGRVLYPIHSGSASCATSLIVRPRPAKVSRNGGRQRPLCRQHDRFGEDGSGLEFEPSKTE